MRSARRALLFKYHPCIKSRKFANGNPVHSYVYTKFVRCNQAHQFPLEHRAQKYKAVLTLFGSNYYLSIVVFSDGQVGEIFLVGDHQTLFIRQVQKTYKAVRC